MNTAKKIWLGVAGGAIALGAPLGLAAAAQADTTPSPTTSATAGAAWRGGHGVNGANGVNGGGMMNGAGYGATGMATYLADKLGVSVDAVTSALATYHIANPVTAPGRDLSDADVATRHQAEADALAKALNVDAAKVKAALDSYDTSRQAQMTAQLKERLDALVKAGTLTQAEADERLASHVAGEPMQIGLGGGAGMGAPWR